jgi:uncharacterized lipoprotein NlpE involved in copper resistance
MFHAKAMQQNDQTGPAPPHYRGVIPCADCQGIETVVILKSDGTFTTHFKYLGKGDEVFSKEGRFTWNAAGSIVTLAGDAQYVVGENHLTRLAHDGSRVTGGWRTAMFSPRSPRAGLRNGIGNWSN